jgi:hypothetical protein
MLIKINKQNITATISSCQKLKPSVSFIQLKPILDIFLRSFGLSGYPQHSLKVLLFPNLVCIFKYKYSGVHKIVHISIRLSEFTVLLCWLLNSQKGTQTELSSFTHADHEQTRSLSCLFCA